MALSENDIEIAGRIERMSTHDYAREGFDVVSEVDRLVSGLTTEDPPENAALIISTASRVAGRLGLQQRLRSLLDRPECVHDSRLRTVVLRHLLNASAVTGDVGTSRAVFDELAARDALDGKVFGALLRAVFASTRDGLAVVSTLRDVARAHPNPPQPVGILEVLEDHADRAVVHGVINSVCRRHGIIVALDANNFDEALRMLNESDVPELGSREVTVAIREIGKAGRTADLVEAVESLVIRGFELDERMCTNLYRTATANADVALRDLADRLSSGMTSRGDLVQARATAYAATGATELILPMVQRMESEGVLTVEAFRAVLDACDRHQESTTAIELIRMNPLVNQRPGRSTEAADGADPGTDARVRGIETVPKKVFDSVAWDLIQERREDEAVDFLRWAARNGASIPSRAWANVVDSLSTESGRPAALLEALRHGASVSTKVVVKTLRDLGFSGAVTPAQYLAVIAAYQQAGLNDPALSLSDLWHCLTLPYGERHRFRHALGQVERGMNPVSAAALMQLNIACDQDDEAAAARAAHIGKRFEPRKPDIDRILGDGTTTWLEATPLTVSERKAVLRGFGRLGMLGNMRQFLDRILEDPETGHDHEYWDIVLSAYIGHDRGASAARSLLLKAEEVGAHLPESTVVTAIRACGANVRQAELVLEIGEDNGWVSETGDEHSPAALAVARSAAVAGVLGKVARYLAGIDRGVKIPERILQTKDYEWWSVYLLGLAYSDLEMNRGNFNNMWRFYTSLYQADKRSNKPRPRRHGPRTHEAMAVFKARESTSPDDQKVREAIETTFEYVLVDKAPPPDDHFFRTLLVAEWSNDEESERSALAAYSTARKRHFSTVRAWTEARTEMARSTGRWAAISNILDNLSVLDNHYQRDDRTDQEALLVALATSAALSGRKAGLAELKRRFDELLAGGSDPRSATLSELIDVAGRAGWGSFAHELHDHVHRRERAGTLDESEVSALLNRLVVCFSGCNEPNEALAVKNSLDLRGRSLSSTARVAYNKAMIDSGHADQIAEVADPAEALSVIALFGSDVVHDITTPLSIIRDYRIAALRNAERDNLEAVRANLNDMKEGFDLINTRIHRIRDLTNALRSQLKSRDGHGPGATDISTPLGPFLARFIVDDATTRELNGVTLVCRPDRSRSGNRDFLVAMPELFVDMAVKNLVRNSVKALTGGGKSRSNPQITITVSDSPVAAEGFPHGFVSLKVMDNGPGIPESTVNALFSGRTISRGADGSEGGVGTGLVLVSTLAHMIEGRLDIPRQKDGAVVELRIHPAHIQSEPLHPTDESEDHD